MRILLLCSAFNSLTQRVFVDLEDVGHDVGASVVTDGGQMRAAVAQCSPELVIAPYLKTAIPQDVWRSRPCLIVHPGIRGDRGPSSLDWAILRGLPSWGVTVLQAAQEFDAGDIWAYREFALGDAPKSALYRHQVADAAAEAVLEAIVHWHSESFIPEPLDYGRPQIEGRLEPSMTQADRAIDWTAPTAVVLRHLRCSDSTPGVLDSLFGEQYYLFGGHAEGSLTGRPGEVIAHRDGAICRATGDGAVWISHAKRAPSGERTFVKLPAAVVLAKKLAGIPELAATPAAVTAGTYREIWYEERADVGYVHFAFYNGAMSTQQCIRLRETYQRACQRPTKVIVLMGGSDLWSNGIDLNVIETAVAPHEESWANINAMNDLVREIVETDSHVVFSALAGNAGAGGVPLALAADEVCARRGVVLNPHYKSMGLFGSEYWTYVLPRRVGDHRAARLTEECLPLGAVDAVEIGLADAVLPGDRAAFDDAVLTHVQALAEHEHLPHWLAAKAAARDDDEHHRPLETYRVRELAEMSHDIFDDRSGFAAARRAFVSKERPLPAAQTDAGPALGAPVPARVG
jgi:putative two-component system protein, hydrogenase maturation factor HypX/HoxX